MHLDVDPAAHAHLVHDRAHHARLEVGELRVAARELGGWRHRVDLCVLVHLAALGLQQLAQRHFAARHLLDLDAPALVEVEREHILGGIGHEEVVDDEDVLRGEVVLGIEPLPERRRLRVVLEEVEGHEGGGQCREVVLLELGAHDVQLEDVLVRPHIELVVGALRDDRVGHAHRVHVDRRLLGRRAWLGRGERRQLLGGVQLRRLGLGELLRAQRELLLQRGALLRLALAPRLELGLERV